MGAVLPPLVRPENRRRKFFSVKVAGVFSEGGDVGLGCLVEGEVGFASFPGFGDFDEDARYESQE